MLKKCFKCRKKKEITEFYKHPKTSDGYLGKCKPCAKKDVKRRYYDPEARLRIIQYERERFQTCARKAMVRIYQQRSRTSHPGKYKARVKVSNAIRDKRLQKEPCKVCGALKVEAHHTDYRSPLKVTWLCRRHHLEEEGKMTYLI